MPAVSRCSITTIGRTDLLTFANAETDVVPVCAGSISIVTSKTHCDVPMICSTYQWYSLAVEEMLMPSYGKQR